MERNKTHGEQKAEVKKDAFHPVVGLKGQVSDQKSDGRVPMTNAVQALTGCPELHTMVSKVPVKILGMFRGHLMEQGTFICSFDKW